MAALYLHHTLFSQERAAEQRQEDEQPFTPHYRKRSIATMESTASSSTVHGPMVSASPGYNSEHRQRQREQLTQSSPSSQQMTSSPLLRPAIQLGASSTPTPPPPQAHILLGGPISMEELRWERDNYHKKQKRKWRAWTLGLFTLLCIWSIYCTIRYWVAFSVYYDDPMRRKFALSLGVVSCLALATLLLYQLFDYLIQEPNVFRIYKSFIYIWAAKFFLVPAIINNVLVSFWRGPPAEGKVDLHTLQGRCKFDIDIIWSGTGQQCSPGDSISYGAFLAGATVRTVLTAVFLVALWFVAKGYEEAVERPRRMPSSASISGSRLMGRGPVGESKSTLHPSTSRLSTASADHLSDPQSYSQYLQHLPNNKELSSPTGTAKGSTRQKLSRSPSRSQRTSATVGTPLSATSPVTSASGSITPLPSPSLTNKSNQKTSTLIYTPYNPTQALDSVPETTELDVVNGGNERQVPFTFGKTPARWTDDPNVETPTMTPAHEGAPMIKTNYAADPHSNADSITVRSSSEFSGGGGGGGTGVGTGGPTSSQTHVGYFPYGYGHEEEDGEEDEEEENRRLEEMAQDFRSLVRSVSNGSGASSTSGGNGRRISEEQRRAILHYQAMGLSPNSPSAPTFPNSDPLWEREVEVVGGVVRRMSTIESLGSKEFNGSEYAGSVIMPMRKSPSPVSFRGTPLQNSYSHPHGYHQYIQQQLPPRPPSRAGTIGTASTGGSGDSSKRSRGTGDSKDTGRSSRRGSGPPPSTPDS